MRCAALELAGYNITVECDRAGFIVTNIGGGHAHDPDTQKAVGKVIPAHRVGFPEDLHGLSNITFTTHGGNYDCFNIVLQDGIR